MGSVPELGQWDVAEAPGMQWTEDHNWVTDVDLPESSCFQFKIVHVSHNGINWEPGSDREIKAQPRPGKSAIAVRGGVGPARGPGRRSLRGLGGGGSHRLRESLGAPQRLACRRTSQPSWNNCLYLR